MLAVSDVSVQPDTAIRFSSKRAPGHVPWSDFIRNHRSAGEDMVAGGGAAAAGAGGASGTSMTTGSVVTCGWFEVGGFGDWARYSAASRRSEFDIR